MPSLLAMPAIDRWFRSKADSLRLKVLLLDLTVHRRMGRPGMEDVRICDAFADGRWVERTSGRAPGAGGRRALHRRGAALS
jgi:hypothetical protein